MVLPCHPMSFFPISLSYWHHPQLAIHPCRAFLRCTPTTQNRATFLHRSTLPKLEQSTCVALPMPEPLELHVPKQSAPMLLSVGAPRAKEICSYVVVPLGGMSVVVAWEAWGAWHLAKVMWPTCTRDPRYCRNKAGRQSNPRQLGHAH